MSPFRTKDRQGFKTRIALPDGRTVIRSCGTSDPHTAADVQRMVAGYRHRREWELLTAVVEKQITLAELYDAHLRNGVRALLSRASDQANDIDLDPLVTTWGGRGKRTVSAVYLRQVREFIPAGARFPLSTFHRGTISAHLEGLKVKSDSTRNRHRAGISAFAKWLVAHRHLDTNPVRDSTSFSENAPRVVELSVEDAKRLVEGLDGDAKIVAAIMLGTGMEWGAVAVLKRRDVGSGNRSIHARGPKTRFRNRYVRVTEDWTWPIIEAAVKLLLPDAPVVTITHRHALDALVAACKRLELPRLTLHDLRHVYAVTALKRGDEGQRVKRQLGHAPNSVLLYSTYAQYADERHAPEIAPEALPIPLPVAKESVR